MASRREIRRRIRSIQNTQQITRAMQMIAASRMRKAQQRVESARPYAEHIRSIVADISGKEGAETHPLLAQREVKHVDVVVLSPDRGLAGGLVVNLNRETSRVVRSQDKPVRVVAVGRKARGYALRSRWNLISEFTGMPDQPGPADIGPIAQQVLDDYENGEADQVFLVYTQFINTLKQQPKTVQLLPVVVEREDRDSEQAGGELHWDYEPDDPTVVLSGLLPRYVEFTIYQAILEAVASFYSAQMVAMRNATDNAEELIEDLTLEMNKARQAEITKEIADISGAAEALRTA